MAGSSDAYKSYRGQIPNTANYKTDLPESVHQRMMRANEMATKRANARKAAAVPARPAGSIDIRGYFGDERTGIRKSAGQKLTSAINAKPAAVVRTTTNMKTSPVKTTPAQRVVMDKNPMGPRKTAAGKNASFGFASTKDMGARAMGALGGLARGVMSGGLKSSPGSPARAAQARAMNKNSVAGPSKTASGKNASFGFGGGKGGKKK